MQTAKAFSSISTIQRTIQQRHKGTNEFPNSKSQLIPRKSNNGKNVQIVSKQIRSIQRAFIRILIYISVRTEAFRLPVSQCKRATRAEYTPRRPQLRGKTTSKTPRTIHNNKPTLKKKPLKKN